MKLLNYMSATGVALTMALAVQANADTYLSIGSNPVGNTA